jgi:ABC-2 type transport system ATP-binding protein
MQRLAAEGRTVFVSSHLLSEMALTASHLVVIGRGRLIAEATTADFEAAASEQAVRVRTPHRTVLMEALELDGATVRATDDDEFGLTVSGAGPDRVGEVAFANGAVLHELTVQRTSLEQAFLQVTGDDVEYVTAGHDDTAAAAAARG